MVNSEKSDEDRARKHEERIAREQSKRVWSGRIGNKGPTKTRKFSSEMNRMDGHAFAKRKGGGFETGDDKAPKKRRIQLSLEETKKWASSPPTGWVGGYDNGITVYTFQGEASTHATDIALTPAEIEEWNSSPPTGWVCRYKKGHQVWYGDKAARRSVSRLSGSTRSPHLWTDELVKMLNEEESHSASPFSLPDVDASDARRERLHRKFGCHLDISSDEDRCDLLERLQRLDGDSPKETNSKVRLLSSETKVPTPEETKVPTPEEIAAYFEELEPEQRFLAPPPKIADSTASAMTDQICESSPTALPSLPIEDQADMAELVASSEEKNNNIRSENDAKLFAILQRLQRLNGDSEEKNNKIQSENDAKFFAILQCLWDSEEKNNKIRSENDAKFFATLQHLQRLNGDSEEKNNKIRSENDAKFFAILQRLRDSEEKNNKIQSENDAKFFAILQCLRDSEEKNNKIRSENDAKFFATLQQLQRLNGDSSKVRIQPPEESEQLLMSTDPILDVKLPSNSEEYSVVPIGGLPREKRARETDSSDVQKVCKRRKEDYVSSSSLPGESEDDGSEEPRNLFSWGSFQVQKAAKAFMDALTDLYHTG